MLERLPEADRAFIKSQVRAGYYASEIEVVRDAVRRRREEDERKRMTVFQAQIMEGHGQILRGETVPYTPELAEKLFAQAMVNAKHGKPVKDAVRP